MFGKPSRPAVFFDLYHTIVDIELDEDSLEFWREIEAHLSQYGSNLSAEDLKALYLELCRQIKDDTLKGQSVLEKLFPTYFRILTSKQADLGQLYALITVFRRRSRKVLKLRKFTLPLLDKLERKGYVCGLISNTEAVFTKIDLEDLGIANRFRTVVLSSDVGAEKPAPEPFLAAMRSLGVKDPGHSIFIGDNFDADIMGAEGVGMKSILIHDTPDEFSHRLPKNCLGIVPTNGKGLYKKIAGKRILLR